VAHETIHQWFYAVVGNNQGTHPFLDEGTTDFFTRDLLNSFRNSSCSRRPLDLTVWDYSGSCYNEVIYVQGGLYLREYRETVGAADFYSGMHNFYVDYKFRIADTRDLLNALDRASGFNSQQHENRFPNLF
jgi:aminopeptidase N